MHTISRTAKYIGRLALAAALLGVVSLALAAQTGDDDAEVDPADEAEQPAEPEEVEEPTSDEIEAYAEVQVTVVEQQIELLETLTEIGDETGLSGQEVTTAEQVLNAAGGDPEAVDETYLDDERYAEAIAGIADARSEASQAIDRAVSESEIGGERFEELTILISHDRSLSAEANALVNERLEEAGVIEEPQVDAPDPEDAPDDPELEEEIDAPEAPDPETAE